MYTIYYYNNGISYQQKSFASLKEAKASFNKEYKGYISNKTGKVLKKY